METIRNYLDNMFREFPDTDEFIKAKASMLSMMEDRFKELLAKGCSENEAVGSIISEFGNLSDFAQELGIKEYMEEEGLYKVKHPKRKVTDYEAKEYIEATGKGGFRIALGVFLCICSPITLIVLSGIFNSDSGSDKHNPVISGIGIAVLLVLVAIAVGIFVYNTMIFAKYDYLKKEVLQLDKNTENELRKMKEQIKPAYMLKITVGVVLCIVGVIPVIIVGSIVDGTTVPVTNKDAWSCASVGLLLFIVAIAVFLFVKAGLQERAFKVLLQEGEFTEEAKDNTLTGNIASVYWPVVTCIYLAWSFISGDWDRSWIIWPIAGVLFGAVASICAVAGKSTKS